MLYRAHVHYHGWKARFDEWIAPSHLRLPPTGQEEDVTGGAGQRVRTNSCRCMNIIPSNTTYYCSSSTETHTGEELSKTRNTHKRQPDHRPSMCDEHIKGV